MSKPLSPVIKIDPEKCVNCHRCIAVCPSKYCNDGSGSYVKINVELCIGCGACTAICPQSIDVPAALAELSERVAAMPKWADVSREREEAAERIKAAKNSTRPTA